MARDLYRDRRDSSGSSSLGSSYPSTSSSVCFALSPDEKSLLSSVIRLHSLGSYQAITSLPNHYQDPLLVLFSWVRIAFEIIENPDQETSVTLHQYQQAFEDTWKTGRHDHVITELMVKLAKNRKLEKQVFIAWIKNLRHHSQQSLFNQKDTDQYFQQVIDPLSTVTRQILMRPSKESADWKALGRWLGWVTIISHLGSNWQLNNQLLLPQDQLSKYDIKGDELHQHKIYHSYEYYLFMQEWSKSLLVYRKQAQKLLYHKHMSSQLKAALLITFELSDWVWRLATRKPAIAWSINISPPTRLVMRTALKWKLQLKWWPHLITARHYLKHQLSNSLSHIKNINLSKKISSLLPSTQKETAAH